MTFRKRLSSKAREELYDAEIAKARELGRGDLPICNLCDGPIDGTKQRWHESHDPVKPRWLGGLVTGIAHEHCNTRHNNDHDTPLYAKSVRQRQKNIGAHRTRTPMQGGRDDNLKKRMDGIVVLRSTNQPWERGQ